MIDFRYLDDILEGSIGNLDADDIDAYVKIANRLEKKFKAKASDIVVVVNPEWSYYFDCTDDKLHFQEENGIKFAFECPSRGTYLFYFPSEDALNTLIEYMEKSTIDESLQEDNSYLHQSRTLYEFNFDVRANNLSDNDLSYLKATIRDAIMNAGYDIEGNIIVHKNDITVYEGLHNDVSYEDDDYDAIDDLRPEWEKDIEWSNIYGGDSRYCRDCHNELEIDNDGYLACRECQPERFEHYDDDFDDKWEPNLNVPIEHANESIKQTSTPELNVNVPVYGDEDISDEDLMSILGEV